MYQKRMCGSLSVKKKLNTAIMILKAPQTGSKEKKIHTNNYADFL